MKQTNGWTRERRKRQSELIRTWRPWVNSTGPRTTTGKAKASQNAFKGGIRPQLRRLARVLRNQQQSLDDLSMEDYDVMADTVVAAALEGHGWAITEMGNGLDGEPE